MKKEVRIKEPVRIRTKRLSNGCESIYLDIYMDGRRRYEFLKLYIIPEHTRTDKDLNQSTMKLASAVKAQRIIELQNGVYGFNHQQERYNADRLYQVFGRQGYRKNFKESVYVYTDIPSSAL